MDNELPGPLLVEFHFDGQNNLKPGTGRKKQITPYVNLKIRDMKGVPTPGLPIWILLIRQWTVTKEEWVTIPRRIRIEAGVTRSRLGRGFAHLEAKGFVELRKGVGKSTRARRK